jgi:hypothetical protein
MEQDVLKTKPLNKTAKLDATTDAAYEIIDKQVLDRERKTARLRAMRLAKEAEKSPETTHRKSQKVG